MCIVVISTAHPDYALVLINNRDEYLHRPTARASWWSHPNAHVLGGRDLLRAEQGTWLGVTAQGGIAVLTNFREEGNVPLEARSRGAMVNAFLTQSPASAETTAEFVARLVHGDGLKGVGGFSLVCGKAGSPLAVVSNRTPSVESLTWISNKPGQTTGLSNATFGDRSWEKVLHGERLTVEAIAESVARKESKAEFVEALMRVLSVDTLPKRATGEGWEIFVRELRHSIFIPAVQGEVTPAVDADDIAAAKSEKPLQGLDRGSKPVQQDGLSGVYGTQTQTVVLVDHTGHLTFVERSLYDSNAETVVEVDRDRVVEFQIENWGH